MSASSVSKSWKVACPQCGADDEIDICAGVWVRLCPDGTDPAAAAIGDHEWTDHDEAMCGCGYHGRVIDFRTENHGRAEQASDPYRQATADAARHAIDRLQVILNEATLYLTSGNHLAAWGTLVLFDEAAEDLKAAIRLHKAANARGLS